LRSLGLGKRRPEWPSFKPIRPSAEELLKPGPPSLITHQTIMTDTPNVTIDVALAQTTQLDAKPNFKRKAHMSTDEVIELEKQRKEFVKERKRMRYGNDVNVNPDREKVDRVPKRRVALLMGYCGSGYRGMQLYVALFDSSSSLG